MTNFFECIVKADLGGKVFPYDYRARLAYVMTFDHPRFQTKQKTNHFSALTIIFHNWLTSSVTSHHIYVQ